MALSHPCPSSLSQLNEPFPRQIKTGESAVTRGRRLRKAIQTGMVGDYRQEHRATVSTAKGHEEKGKRGAGERGAGSTRGHELHLPSAQYLAGGRGSHSSRYKGSETWRRSKEDGEGGRWQGGDPGAFVSSGCRSCTVHKCWVEPAAEGWVSVLPTCCFLSVLMSPPSEQAEQARRHLYWPCHKLVAWLHSCPFSAVAARTVCPIKRLLLKFLSFLQPSGKASKQGAEARWDTHCALKVTG